MDPSPPASSESEPVIAEAEIKPSPSPTPPETKVQPPDAPLNDTKLSASSPPAPDVSSSASPEDISPEVVSISNLRKVKRPKKVAPGSVPVDSSEALHPPPRPHTTAEIASPSSTNSSTLPPAASSPTPEAPEIPVVPSSTDRSPSTAVVSPPSPPPLRPPPGPPPGRREKQPFQVGSIVLVKMTSYPWWPAEVISEKSASAEQLAARKPADTHLVDFFNDASSCWIDCSDRSECVSYWSRESILEGDLTEDHRETLLKANRDVKCRLRKWERRRLRRKGRVAVAAAEEEGETTVKPEIGGGGVKSRSRKRKREVLSSGGSSLGESGIDERERKRRKLVYSSYSLEELIHFRDELSLECERIGRDGGIGPVEKHAVREPFRRTSSTNRKLSYVSLFLLLEEIADANVTFIQLKDTKVGRVLNTLRNCYNDDVRLKAREIIAKWKRIVLEEMAKRPENK